MAHARSAMMMMMMMMLPAVTAPPAWRLVPCSYYSVWQLSKPRSPWRWHRRLLAPTREDSQAPYSWRSTVSGCG
jgi:hypothetical protein